MKRCRVQITNFDRLPRSLVTSLLQRAPDIEIVTTEVDGFGCRSLTTDQLATDLNRERPDVLVVGVEDDDELERYARMAAISVLLLCPRSSELRSYAQRPGRRLVGDLSGSRLLSVIRATQGR